MDLYPFLGLDGLDGTGKTTLRKGLFRLMETLTGATPLSVLTTNFLDPAAATDLVSGKYEPTPDNRDAYLKALGADKNATCTRLVVPSLPHRPVIADRWLLSEMAFFSVKHGQDPAVTYAALADSCPVAPDLTFVLDITPEAAMQRAGARQGDAVRADWDVLDVQTHVRGVYQHVIANADAYPKLGRIVVIDANQTRAEILHQAWTALDAHGLTRSNGDT